MRLMEPFRGRPADRRLPLNADPLATLDGSANMVQSNTVAQRFSSDLGIPSWVTGLVMAFLVGT